MALGGNSPANSEGGLCGNERGCPQGETGQACFVFSGRPKSLGREPALSTPAGSREQISPENWGRVGCTEGQLAGRCMQGERISPLQNNHTICTRISKHKTPKRGHSKPKAAANHLFNFFLKLAAMKNFRTLKHNTRLNIFIHL